MTNTNSPTTLDVVALLADLPAEGLAQGQVGTIVEPLNAGSVLVEFADDEGRPYAIAACPINKLLVLRYARQAA